jgi:hypothetical protein
MGGYTAPEIKEVIPIEQESTLFSWSQRWGNIGTDSVTK